MIAVIRGLASISAIEKSWLPVRRDVPKAPGLGLMLEEVGLNAHLTAKSVSFYVVSHCPTSQPLPNLRGPSDEKLRSDVKVEMFC